MLHVLKGSVLQQVEEETEGELASPDLSGK